MSHNGLTNQNEVAKHNSLANQDRFNTPSHGGHLMRTGQMMHFDEACARIAADDLGKWDANVRREDVVMKDGHLAFPLDNRGEHWEHLTPTRWATGQLCARLGIPASYFRKCPSLLQDVQANYWLKDCNVQGKAEPWLLRARHGNLRAVLSEHYSPLDNGTLMERLAPMLKNRYHVDWLGLAEESLHLRVVDPLRTRDILPNDAVTVGIHIANSEVGFRAVTVDALVYRLVCSNGLIRLVKGKSLLRQRHIHIATPRFVAALEEAVANALSEADNFIEQLRRTTAQPVNDVEETVKKIGERWNLAESTRQSVLDSLLHESRGQSHTVYGLVNALTNAAQRLSNEERYDLEVLAGRLVEQGLHQGKKELMVRPHPHPVLQSGVTQSGLAAAEAIGLQPDSEGSPPPAPADGIRWSAVELARQMFDAEIVNNEASPEGQRVQEREAVPA